MAEKFKLNIISPERSFYEGDCEFLEFVSTEGELGVYAKHIPLTTILEPCVMKIHSDGEEKKAAILGGFVEILKERRSGYGTCRGGAQKSYRSNQYSRLVQRGQVPTRWDLSPSTILRIF